MQNCLCVRNNGMHGPYKFNDPDLNLLFLCSSKATEHERKDS
jgi:hypothetical protein